MNRKTNDSRIARELPKKIAGELLKFFSINKNCERIATRIAEVIIAAELLQFRANNNANDSNGKIEWFTSTKIIT